MIRTILFAVVLVSALSVKGQAPLSLGGMNGSSSAFRHFNEGGDTNRLQKKWFVTKFASLSTGFIAFNGGSATYLSAPVGLQLNRQLTNNLFAFANVSVEPTFLHFNSAFMQPGIAKNSGLMNFNNSNNLSINPAARMGLMYVNDQRTFSISGSIGVSRNNYGYSPFYGPVTSPVFNNSRF